MKTKILLALASFTIVGCSGGSVLVKSGQGEYANDVQTKQHIVQVKSRVNDYYSLIARYDVRKSDFGAVDDRRESLIENKEIWGGFAIHSPLKNGEYSQIAFITKDDSFKMELSDKRQMWGGFGSKLGLSHQNRYRKGRKTTGASVGLWRRFYGIDYSMTWHIRNNTKSKTDDYLIFGVEKYF